MIYGSFALLLIATYYLVMLPVFNPFREYIPFVRKFSFSLFLIAVIFLISKVLERLINSQDSLEGDRYNLLRIVHFLAIVFSIIVAASFLFQNLYAAAVSFGLISLVVGFALQAVSLHAALTFNQMRGAKMFEPWRAASGGNF